MADPRRTRLAFEPLESRTVPTVITVTSTGDGVTRNGVVTLREAIEAADSHKAVGDVPAPAAGPVTIRFNIPGSGTHVIKPLSALPVLAGDVTIDGTSQHGYDGTPLIEIDGASAGAQSNGFVLLGGKNTVRGLDITQFKLNGIVVASADNTIAGDWIGLNPSGFQAAGNGAEGIVVVGADNLIGGTTAGARVVISGNRLAGIDLTTSKAYGNDVVGDYIGTDATGFASIPNGTGLLIGAGSHSNQIGGTTDAARNVICGNIDDQIEITGKGTSSNVVTDNYIGVDSSGESAAQEGGDGVQITDGATDNRIGGTTLDTGNLIAGIGLWTFGKAAGAGVELDGSTTSGNLIEGNWIGIDSRGLAPLSDIGGGIRINGAGRNTVGGSGLAENVIADAANSSGLTSSNHVMPKNWDLDSIQYYGHPNLLGGTFRA